MAVSFDDLIPASPQPAPSGLSFDDLIPAPPQPNSSIAGAFKGASRALEANLPFVDRAVAGAQSILAPGYGGTGQDYATNLATERAKNAQFASDNPGTNVVGGITAAAPLMAMGGPGGIAGGALTGAGIGAVEGASQAPDLTDWSQGGVAKNALSSALMGAGIGAGGGVIGAGLGKLAPAAVDASVPTLDTIGPMKSAAYQAADQLGAAYKPEAISGLVSKISSDAKASNIDPRLNPRASAAIDALQTQADAAVDAGTPITLTQLDQARQFVNRNVTNNPEPSERYFGNQIRNNIDEFIANAGPEHMAEGAAPEAADAIQNARDLNTRYMKSQALADALEKAGNRAASTYSGGNLDNATRQQVRRLAEGRTAWTPDEAAQLQTAMKGGPVQNALRYAGKVMAPSGLIGAGELGALVAGHPAALGIAGAGLGAKTGANALTEANTRTLMNTILRGGTAALSQPPLNLSPGANALAAALSANSSAGR